MIPKKLKKKKYQKIFVLILDQEITILQEVEPATDLFSKYFNTNIFLKAHSQVWDNVWQMKAL